MLFTVAYVRTFRLVSRDPDTFRRGLADVVAAFDGMWCGVGTLDERRLRTCE